MINNNFCQFLQSKLKVHLLLLSVQLMFAILPVLSKIAFKTFAPEIILFFRAAGAALIFSIFFFPFLYEKINSKKDFLYLAMLGIFGVALNQFLFLKGVYYSTAVNANIIITTIPIFTLLIAYILSYEKITCSKIIGILVALIGVFLILDIKSFSLSTYSYGNLLIVINSISYSLYLVLAKPILRKYKPFTIITYVFIFATIEIVPLCYKSFLNTNFTVFKISNYIVPACIVFFSTFLPYTINTKVLSIVDSSIVAIYVYVQPLFGTIFSILILNEIITLRIIIAASLIFLGVALVSSHQLLPKRKKILPCND